jgi:licheninase
VALWRAVAEHFADNAREDLFLELLNEPELAFDGHDPTESEWTSIAERMIAGIREVDTRHSIIFGGTHYYGIDTLMARALLSDSNVIYAFHTYSPYLFTHQGAEWANMGALHDIPYPYDPARGSERSVSFGFISSTDRGSLGLASSYYRDGNRSALRNKVLAAKRWGLAHDAPVICNEFGAYGRTSRLDDRARYYADAVSIFAELEIPWQLWFGVMDRDGSVPPELQEALRLGR